MQAESGHPWEDIARAGYQAYAATTGNKNFQGNPMPQWEDLPEGIRKAWEAASRHVAACVETPADGELPDPAYWSNWVKP